MFHHRLDEDIDSGVFVKWYLLSFLAGSVNAGGFLAAGRFVSHVTGFATLFGVDAAYGNWDAAIGMLSVPAFFLCGTMISGYLIDHRHHRRLRPHYDWVMFLVFLCLVTVMLVGRFRGFGSFGDPLILHKDYFFLALLCLASGLQNAAITTASGATVRTTHLTGLTTDLGLGIVRVLGTKKSHAIHKSELRANWLRVGTILSYSLGSLVGAWLFIRWQYMGFALPSAIALYATVQARKEQGMHSH